MTSTTASDQRMFDACRDRAQQAHDRTGETYVVAETSLGPCGMMYRAFEWGDYHSRGEHVCGRIVQILKDGE